MFMHHPYLLPALYWFLGLSVALAGATLVLLALGTYLSQTRQFKKMTLPDLQTVEKGYSAPHYTASLVGQEGITQTPLRPAGKILLAGHTYNATTEGTYLAADRPVVVTAILGHTLVVQAAPAL